MTKTTKEEDCDMSALNKVNWPGVGNILGAIVQITAVLGNCPCKATGVGDHGHQFFIHPLATWTTLDGVTADTVVNKLATFTGSTHAKQFIYDTQLKIYHEKEKHRKGTPHA